MCKADRGRVLIEVSPAVDLGSGEPSPLLADLLFLLWTRSERGNAQDQGGGTRACFAGDGGVRHGRLRSARDSRWGAFPMLLFTTPTRSVLGERLPSALG